MRPRKKPCCYCVKLEEICNELGDAIEGQQQLEKEKTGRKVSKEKVIMRWLREHLEFKKAS